MQTLKSAQAMADAMRGVTSAMKSMNTKLNIPSLQNILKEFERQNEKMEMTTMSCMIDGFSTMKAHAPTTSSEAKEPATPKSSAKN